MKNKLFKLTALWIVVVGLAGCQSNENVLPIAENLANKTLLGYYTHTTLDSATMQTASEEYYLMRDANDEQKGYYRTSVIGDNAYSDEQSPLTWSSKIADDQRSMLITATLDKGQVKNFIWQDGVVKENDNWFDKNAGDMSSISLMKTIYLEQLNNVVFEKADTTFHSHTVKAYYLAWEAKRKQQVAAEDTASVKQGYLNKLLPQMDTIIWFLKNKTSTGYIGNRTHYENIDGKDTIIDLVYVTGSGPYSVYYLASTRKYDEVQINDQPATILYSNMTFNRVNNLNTASYKWQKSEYSIEHYLKPGRADDKGSDSVYTFTATKWVVPGFTNLAKFDVMMYGTGDSTISKIEAGVQSVVKQETYQDVYQTLNLSSYGEKMNPKDSSMYVRVIQNNIEYRLKQ